VQECKTGPALSLLRDAFHCSTHQEILIKKGNPKRPLDLFACWAQEAITPLIPEVLLKGLS
jgi:hypothetical protein